MSPKNDHPGGLDLEDGALDTGQHGGELVRGAAAACVESVMRRGQAKLLEEDIRELCVVVLTGVQDRLFEARIARSERERPRLYELRPIADNRE